MSLFPTTKSDAPGYRHGDIGNHKAWNVAYPDIPSPTPAKASAYPRIRGFTHRYTTSVSRFTSTYVSPIDSRHPCTSPPAGKVAAILSRHTRVPNYVTNKGVLYFNPGSSGPRRFKLPVTIGLLTVGEDNELAAEIVPLDRA